MNIDAPLRFTSDGRTAATGGNAHIEQMLAYLLYTNPGERVMRPSLGSGVQQLLFAPNSLELAATVQFTMQGAIQQYLGDLIAISSLTVTPDDSTLTIAISYVVRSTGQQGSLLLTQS